MKVKLKTDQPVYFCSAIAESSHKNIVRAQIVLIWGAVGEISGVRV
jgi:hypothetical protein